VVTAEEVIQPPLYEDFRPLTIVAESGSVEDLFAAIELQIKETPKTISKTEKVFR
jgi:hypothetical protein